MDKEYDQDDVLEGNEEILEDLEDFDASSIVVYSRDWTIETILNQIAAGNINLNPLFQRRNAWNDDKRSKLLESVIIGYPIPEIVLAEDPHRKKSFIVIDGKQRLLTIAGFFDQAEFSYWTNPSLINLKVRKDLNKVDYDKLKNDPLFATELREFQNASLRCTIITNFSGNDILYDVFYRLNSGSVPLSTQELRQVLNRGDFANYLISVTNELQPIHGVMGLDGPDKRLKDIEVLLRVLAMILDGKSYTGNLKKFLDDWMGKITKEWAQQKVIIELTYQKINIAINYLSAILGATEFVGRKITNGKFEKRFNRVVFELQLFFFTQVDVASLGDPSKFIELFADICDNDPDFRSSLESSTKNMANYIIRYNKFEKLFCEAFSLEMSPNPFQPPL